MSDEDKTGLMIAGERVGGMQGGRNTSLLDWRHRREVKDFAVLVNRLRARKWRIENPERYRKRQREHARKPKVREQRAAWKARRREKALKSTVYTCEHCGAQWCRVPWVQPRSHTRFCSSRCTKAAARRAAGKARQLESAVRSCPECSAEVRGRAQFCSTACRLRARYHAKNPGARRIARRGGRS